MNPAVPTVTHTFAAWLAGPEPLAPDWSLEHWQAFKMAARVHGVGPLLHARLQGLAWLPGEIGAWLADQYRFNQARITRLQEDLNAILAACAAGEVDAMPLKGSLLAAGHYPDPALRPMADLDLLVRPSDRTRAEAVLDSLGYCKLSASWKHQEWGLPGNLEVVSAGYEHPDNPRKVDLHTSVEEMLGGPRLDITAELWQSAEPSQLLGQPAWLPHIESLWLHLAVHTNANIWGLANRLLYLFDLALLPAPCELAAADSRFVHLALGLLCEVFPAPERLALLDQSARGLSPEFLSLAQGFDLHSSSYLGRQEAPHYLTRLFNLYRGNPGDLLAALRFLLLPSGDEIDFEKGQKGRLRPFPLAWSRLFVQKLSMVARLLRA